MKRLAAVTLLLVLAPIYVLPTTSSRVRFTRCVGDSKRVVLTLFFRQTDWVSLFA